MRIHGLSRWKNQQSERIGQILMSLSPKLCQSLIIRQSTVTLLGDAIHTMPPFRGVGANTALRDAELLRRKLVDVATKDVPLLQAIGEYEVAMRDYGFEAVRNTLERPLFGAPGSRSRREVAS